MMRSGKEKKQIFVLKYSLTFFFINWHHAGILRSKAELEQYASLLFRDVRRREPFERDEDVFFSRHDVIEEGVYEMLKIFPDNIPDGVPYSAEFMYCREFFDIKIYPAIPSNSAKSFVLMYYFNHAQQQLS